MGGGGGGGKVMGRWTDGDGCWLGPRGIRLRGLLEAALSLLGAVLGHIVASVGLLAVLLGPPGRLLESFWGPHMGLLGASWGDSVSLQPERHFTTEEGLFTTSQGSKQVVFLGERPLCNPTGPLYNPNGPLYNPDGALYNQNGHFTTSA